VSILTKITNLGNNEEPDCLQSQRTNYLCQLQFLPHKRNGVIGQYHQLGASVYLEAKRNRKVVCHESSANGCFGTTSVPWCIALFLEVTLVSVEKVVQCSEKTQNLTLLQWTLEVGDLLSSIPVSSACKVWVLLGSTITYNLCSLHLHNVYFFGGCIGI
jgi:hypothetical protein